MSTTRVGEYRAIAWHYAQEEQQQGLTDEDKSARCVNPQLMSKTELGYHNKYVLKSPVISKEQLKIMVDKWKTDKETAAAFIEQRLAVLDLPQSRRGSRTERQQLVTQEEGEEGKGEEEHKTGAGTSSSADIQQLIRAEIQQQIKQAMLGSGTETQTATSSGKRKEKDSTQRPAKKTKQQTNTRHRDDGDNDSDDEEDMEIDSDDSGWEVKEDTSRPSSSKKDSHRQSISATNPLNQLSFSTDNISWADDLIGLNAALIKETRNGQYAELVHYMRKQSKGTRGAASSTQERTILSVDSNGVRKDTELTAYANASGEKRAIKGWRDVTEAIFHGLIPIIQHDNYQCMRVFMYFTQGISIARRHNWQTALYYIEAALKHDGAMQQLSNGVSRSFVQLEVQPKWLLPAMERARAEVNNGQSIDYADKDSRGINNNKKKKPNPGEEAICKSWNKGTCKFGDKCWNKHICSKCNKDDHTAKGCSQPDQPDRGNNNSRRESTGTGNGQQKEESGSTFILSEGDRGEERYREHSYNRSKTSQQDSIQDVLTSIQQLNINRPFIFDTPITCKQSGHTLHTELNSREWHSLLTDYPQKEWAYRLVHDIIYGVDIGYTGIRKQTRQARNIVDNGIQEQAIDEEIAKEVQQHRLIGPYQAPPFKHWLISPLMTVPKKGNVGNWRVVHHLSHPRGRSINSFIKDWQCTLTRFAAAIKIVCKLGRGCKMAKLDIKSAYRLIPIRTSDWPLLGMKWKNKFYFHTSLPFGLKSSCHIWERYATAAEWIVRNQLSIEDIEHYVDDFFLAALTHLICKQQLEGIANIFCKLGMIIATEKTIEPTTRIVYLGITIDSDEMSISLGPDKIANIMELLDQWMERETCSMKQLQSVIGTLQWAANVVTHGRTFIQRLRDLEQEYTEVKDHTDESSIIINEDSREDVEWWCTFIRQWNGISLLWDQEWINDQHILQPFTDACDTGYGAVCGKEWFHGEWNQEQEEMANDGTTRRASMPWKELYALVTAAATWGHRWNRKRITFRTDCQPVVDVLTKGAARSKRMMQLIRFLHFHAAKHSFIYRVIHIPAFAGMPEQHQPFANHPCAASHPEVVEHARRFLGLAIGSSTRRSYSSGVNSYLQFVDSMGITPAFPASMETICLWISHLAAPPQNLKLGTCKLYLSAIINQHVERGFNNPLDNAPPMITRIMTGIKRWNAYSTSTGNNNSSKQKLPISTSMIRSMEKHLSRSRSDTLIRAMIWIATTAMLRISEFTINNTDDERMLTVAQITFINTNNTPMNARARPKCEHIKQIILHLKASKTDPFRNGVDITISTRETIEAICTYIDLTTTQHLQDKSPIFSTTTGQAVNRQWFMKRVNDLLERSGYNTNQYSSHSFRKGGAVSLQNRGISDSLIRTMGRWRSQAYHSYLKHPINDSIVNAGLSM